MEVAVRSLCLKGLPGPIEFASPLEFVADDVKRVLVGWPEVACDELSSREPLMTVSGTPDAVLLNHRYMDTPRIEPSPTSAICSLIVELMADFVDGDDSLGNLHAGAVEFADRLVVFPATNRAGKSTLVGALASHGHRVFADDLLPIDLVRLEAIASGCLPRLRLPLPESAPDTLKIHVAANALLNDGYYTYLPAADAQLAVAHGDRSKLGALVLLDRREGDITPSIEAIEPDEALLRVLLQDTKNGLGTWTLDRYLALVGTIGIYRLVYSRVDDAVTCLQANFASWPEQEQRALQIARAAEPDEDADDDDFAFAPKPGQALIARAPHVVARVVGQAAFLVDLDSNDIHHLNQVGLALWNLIAKPLDVETIVDIFQEAFPDTPEAQLRADLAAAVDRFLKSGLAVLEPPLAVSA
ncbi:PqqD family peptide modification chaperone [Georhizobium profundi]|uniref:PqqD family peptide modification chaperone n=1 Tax=Georhizobium profundi TaxID=2341112 RepID=A0A3S9B6E9_9HYPH|nr:PqqD family peptide modification chaperone [Georhizobium profundi]